MKQFLYKFYLFIALCAGLFGSLSELMAQQSSLIRVAVNDCGLEGAQPFLIEGKNYTLPAHFKAGKKSTTCNFGGKVIYAFNHLDIHADYELEVVYFSDAERYQHIVVDGNELQSVKLAGGVEQRYLLKLPRKAYAYGQLVLVFELNGKGANALVSELNLYSSNPKKPVPFEGEAKQALKKVQTYKVDTHVDAEKVLPTYALVPQRVKGIYQPILSLSGSWLFHPQPEKEFYKRPATEEWKPIIVPAQWSMQGFAVDSMDFAGYRKQFELPHDWIDKTVKVRFDGVHSEYFVYLNGNQVGYHLGGMTPCEINLTKFLKSGTNELALLVRSESLADMLGSLTQYAVHQLGGITRKVTLFALPRTHLSDLRIVTALDKKYENAALKIQTAVTNTTYDVQRNLKIRVLVDGFTNVIEKSLPELQMGETWSGILSDSIVAPMLWDNEHPNLYTLRMELYQDDRLTEQVEKRFGFRAVEIRGNELLVNGKSVKLRGVCHHEIHPLMGRVLNRELLKRDVELYRAANCNFIRTSHYPPCEEMLELCDEMGMFVEVESPVCWMGHHANANWLKLDYRDEKYYEYVLQANMETIHFYRNHPSVLFWSMANESYWNKGFAQVEEYVKKADPSRPHTFHDQAYGGFNNQGSTAPIANIHYPGPNGYKIAAKSERPMIYGEYCHLNVYNRSELVTDPGVRSDWALALHPTWENMYRTKGVLGGSIWSGIDDIFQLPDGKACGYGAWGPIDGWRRPKPEYWDMKKIYSPIKVTTKALFPAHELVVNVENRYTFMNLNEVKMAYRYGEEKGVMVVTAAPSEMVKIAIPIKDPEAANELYLSFTDPRGFVADEYLIPVGEQTQNEISVPEKISTRLKTRKSEYIITGKLFNCRVSRITGQILSLTKQNNMSLVGGPMLMALPLTGGGCFPNHNVNTPLVNDLCSDWKATSVTASKQGEDVLIQVSGSYNEFKGNYELLINANGEIQVSYQFEALKAVNPRQWGMVFESVRNYDCTFWRRKGMWSVYPENHISRPVGSADLFYKGLPQQDDPRVKPSHSWNMDYNLLGSNDFRSTRRNIWYAGLKDELNRKIVVRSNGKQHWRSWLEGDKIRFLVADFVTAGNEMFLDAYYTPYRKPIKKGDCIHGKIHLIVE